MATNNKKFKSKGVMILAIYFGLAILSSIYFVHKGRKHDLPIYTSIVVAREIQPEFGRKYYVDKTGGKLDLEQYTFVGDYGIKIGDSLVKLSGSDTLIFYRKTKDGKYRRFGHKLSD